ncbi:MAG: hypothetical protein P8P30_00445 [Rickettsiales bacterium]|nr:hypothetical protein [Rickettsiales bacterium]
MTSLVMNTLQITRFPLIYILMLLVLVAFLAGSITVGADFTHKSHTKALASDVAHYESLLNHFQTTYNALPGDMSNASSYWANCRHDMTACNGNGDGVISNSASDSTPEAAQVWQHLSLSGMVSENYSGDLISGYYVPGENIPAAPYKDSGYLISHDIAYHHASWDNAHHLKVGAMSGWQFENAAVTLSDAMAIDHKMDDGIASTGTVLSHSTPEEGCLENYHRETLVGKQVAHYATHLSKDAKCSVYFRMN